MWTSRLVGSRRARLADGSIALVAVDDRVLDQLVLAATTDACANEVTPPLTPDGGWTRQRVEWLRRFHRERRPGLDGPKSEATWAVVEGDRVLGSARLERTDEPNVLEMGIWLTRGSRRHGVGYAATTALLQMAASHGARAVRAETTAGNEGALKVLERIGFTLDAVVDSPDARALPGIGLSAPRTSARVSGWIDCRGN